MADTAVATPVFEPGTQIELWWKTLAKRLAGGALFLIQPGAAPVKRAKVERGTDSGCGSN